MGPSKECPPSKDGSVNAMDVFRMTRGGSIGCGEGTVPPFCFGRPKIRAEIRVAFGQRSIVFYADRSRMQIVSLFGFSTDE